MEALNQVLWMVNFPPAPPLLTRAWWTVLCNWSNLRKIWGAWGSPTGPHCLAVRPQAAQAIPAVLGLPPSLGIPQLKGSPFWPYTRKIWQVRGGHGGCQLHHTDNPRLFFPPCLLLLPHSSPCPPKSPQNSAVLRGSLPASSVAESHQTEEPAPA